MTVFELAAKLSLDSSEYENGLTDAMKTANKFAGKLDSGIDKLLKIGGVAASAAIAGVVSFGKAAVDTGMQFDKSMSQVAATLGMTVDDIGELRDFAQKMGAETVFSATQAADALNYMALAGYDSKKSMEMLPTVLNLAAAGNFDLARASDMVTDAESAFGLTTEETAAMVDQMAKAASRSNTSVEQLGEAFLTIGGTAKFMSGGTDRLATVLGILADNGIKSSEAGTHLRNMLLKLSAPTADGEKVISELGLKIFDTSGNMRDMQDIILDLGEAMEGMTDEDKVKAISDLFNARDVAAVNALLGTSQERWNELGTSIKESAGAAGQMAETQLDNLNGDITLMNSALEGTKIAFSDGITPALRDTVQTVTKALSKSTTRKYLQEIGQQIGNVITAMTKWTGNALPRVIKLFSDGAPKVKAFGIAMGTIAVAVKAAVNPVGALVTGIGLLTGRLALAALGADDASKRFSHLTDAQLDNIDAVKEAADSYRDTINSRNKSIVGISEETGRIKDLWAELQSLAGANGEVDEANKARVEYITGELNEALGTELSLNGNILENYQEQAKAIDTLIQKRHAEKLLEAGEAGYDKAKSQLSQTQATIYTQKKDLDDLEGQLADLRSEQAEIEAVSHFDRTAEQGARLAEIKADASELESLIETRRKDYDESLALETNYIQTIQAYKDAEAALMEGNYAKVAEIYEKDILNRWKHLTEMKTLSSEELDQLATDAGNAGAAWQRYYDNYMAGVDGYTKEGLEQAKQTYDELSQVYQDAVDAASEKGGENAEAYAGGIESGEADAKASGAALVDAAMLGMDERAGAFIGKASALGAAAGAAFSGGSGRKAPTSHAIGLDYVPYDNYPILAHRGETLLTAREADDWRRGRSGEKQIVNQFTFNGVSQSDLDYIVNYVNREMVMG